MNVERQDLLEALISVQVLRIEFQVPSDFDSKLSSADCGIHISKAGGSEWRAVVGSFRKVQRYQEPPVQSQLQ